MSDMGMLRQLYWTRGFNKNSRQIGQLVFGGLCNEVHVRRIEFRIIGYVLLTVVSVTAQTSQTKVVPCPAKGVPAGWMTYVNRSYGFCFSYPPSYYQIQKPWLTKYTETKEYSQYILKAAREGRVVRLQPKQTEKSPIEAELDDQAFNLDSLARLAPTGIEGPPEPQQIGTETFYYYGPGGGGVAYADRYFLDVRGKTLSIAFEAGPSNIPSSETRSIEKPLLQTFRTF